MYIRKFSPLLFGFLWCMPGQVQLAPNAPKDQVFAIKQNEANAIKELVKQAKGTWPPVRTRFEIGLPKNDVLFVSVQLADSSNRHETVFIKVLAIHETTIKGVIANEIGTVQGYKEGQSIEFPESAILDWTISKPDGSEEGNLVGKYLESQNK